MDTSEVKDAVKAEAKKPVTVAAWVLLAVLVVGFVLGWSAHESWDGHHVKVQAVTVEQAK